MANFTQYCTLAQLKAFYTNITDAVDDAVITEALAEAQNLIDGETRWSFQDEARSNEEISEPQVKIDNDGYLQIRVDKCPVTAVSSVAYRFQPMDTWTTIDSTLIEFFPTPSTIPYPRANSNLILCYAGMQSYRAAGARVRVKITYQGGFQSANPPVNLTKLARRLGYWLYRQKDVVDAQSMAGKTAMPALGQVYIPSALPPDVASDLMKWKRWA